MTGNEPVKDLEFTEHGVVTVSSRNVSVFKRQGLLLYDYT